MLNLTNCTCKNGKYLESIADDSAVTKNEIIEVTNTMSTNIFPTKTISTKLILINFTKKVTGKIKTIYILFTF